MAYTDDSVTAKLSSLNETQDSIVTVAQWIMFHRRHAKHTAALWLNRLQDSTSTAKRLNLIYLANEVVQQSRARSRTDFLLAFEPLIADAATLAYKGASQDVQGKIRRVVEVWRQRQIFNPQVQEQTEKVLDELDKARGVKSLGGGGARLGGSLFGASAIAPDLDPINKSQTALDKSETATKASADRANDEYLKMTDPSQPLPSAPVRAAKLRGLVKDLMAAQKAVETSIKTRRDLLAGLDRLIDSNRAKVAADESAFAEFSNKINSMEDTIRDIEDSIMRGVDVPSPLANGNGNGFDDTDPARPETEGFTPPPPDVESFTPPPPQDLTLAGDPVPVIGDGTLLEQAYLNPTGADPIVEQPPNFNEPPPDAAFQDPAAAAKEFLENLGKTRQASTEIPVEASLANANDPRLKRRKMSHKSNHDVDEEIFGASNVGGVDEDGISAMLEH